MNSLLIAGCAAGGGVAGYFLDVIAARVPPAADPMDAAMATSSDSSAGSGPGSLEQPPAFDGTVGPDAPGSPGASRAQTRSAISMPGGEAGPPDGAPGPTRTAAGASSSVSSALAGTGSAPGPHGGDHDGLPARPVPATSGVVEKIAVVVLTAVLFGAAAVRFGAVPALAPYCVFFGGLVTLSVADIRVGLVPRKILYPTLFLMSLGLLAASAVGDDWWSMATAAIGGAIGFVAFLVLYILFPRGMGFGDVRLAGLIGVGLGWLTLTDLYSGFLCGFIAGALYGTVKMLVQGSGRKTRFPFAPGLCVGAVIGVLWGGWLASYWVLHST